MHRINWLLASVLALAATTTNAQSSNGATWAWQSDSAHSDGKITLPTSGTPIAQNPTAGKAAVNQSAATQPPLVLIGGGGVFDVAIGLDPSSTPSFTEDRTVFVHNPSTGKWLNLSTTAFNNGFKTTTSAWGKGGAFVATPKVPTLSGTYTCASLNAPSYSFPGASASTYYTGNWTWKNILGPKGGDGSVSFPVKIETSSAGILPAVTSQPQVTSQITVVVQGTIGLLVVGSSELVTATTSPTCNIFAGSRSTTLNMDPGVPYLLRGISVTVLQDDSTHLNPVLLMCAGSGASAQCVVGTPQGGPTAYVSGAGAVAFTRTSIGFLDSGSGVVVDPLGGAAYIRGFLYGSYSVGPQRVFVQDMNLNSADRCNLYMFDLSANSISLLANTYSQTGTGTFYCADITRGYLGVTVK